MALNKLPSNASLKEAVTQTENINTEISTLKGKLKANLVNKGVSATDSDKMSTLIDKVPSVGIAPSGTFVFKTPRNVVRIGEISEDVMYFYLNQESSIKLSFTSLRWNNNYSWDSTINFQFYDYLTGSLIGNVSFTSKPSTTPTSLVLNTSMLKFKGFTRVYVPSASFGYISSYECDITII